MNTQQQTFNFAFWFHLSIMLLSWFIPFLVDWRLCIVAYIIVQLQFDFLGICVVNKHHDLEEKDNYTFYAHVFELVGFDVNHKKMKFYVRKISNYFYAAITIFWQIILGIEPLLFQF